LTALRRLAAAGVLATLAACGRAPHPANAPAAGPSAAVALPQGVPVFAGAPPARLRLEAQPLDVDPDGSARWLVRAHFVDARGRPTELLGGGDVAFVPSHGSAQWQTRMRFGAPAAIVSTDVDGPLSVRVSAAVGVPVPPATVATDTRAWRVPRVVARPLGAHTVALGWFPRVAAGTVLIARGNGESSHPLATVAAPSSGFRDESVAPGASYRYELAFPDGGSASFRIDIPHEPKHGSLEALAGKSVWLSFSPSSADGDGYNTLDPAAIVARAHAAGLRSIVLRTTYGPFEEIAPAAKPTIDAILDGAAARGISIIAWTVPRSTGFEDVAAEVAAASYVTPSGNGFAALAVDLERGGYFLGDGASGYAALGSYLRLLRAALGPEYPLIATVEDPYLEHLTRASYPYDAIATSADALQPMVYWRVASARVNGPRAVRETLRASYVATLREAGRRVPINLGLQSGGEGPRGAPPPEEIAASIRAARDAGAFGVTFFDWGGTPPGDWKAIATTAW